MAPAPTCINVVVHYSLKLKFSLFPLPLTDEEVGAGEAKFFGFSSSICVSE